MSHAKKQEKLQKRLGEIRQRNPHGRCWVCGSTSGVKSSRMSYGIRCKACIKNGHVSTDVMLYERLKWELGKLLLQDG